MPTIEFVREKRVIEVEQGVNLREAAIREYISLYPHILKILNCRGRGLCTSCVVEIVSGEVDCPNEIESLRVKNKLEKNPNIRLGCQVTVNQDIKVRTCI